MKGRILRVKRGYNPNSSSMGSIIFALPAALLGITAGFGAVSGVIMSAFIKKDSAKNSAEEKIASHEQGKKRNSSAVEGNEK